MQPDHMSFVCASYLFAATVLLMLVAVSYRQWRKVKGDYQRLFTGKGKTDA